MSARLQINCGPGRKETVQVSPNTTMGFVLDEVCKRRKLNPAEHVLKHQRDLLDSGQTVRFSGLSNNATLDLISQTKPVTAAHGECTVALQLESGERRTAKLNTATTLQQVIEQLAPATTDPTLTIEMRAAAVPGEGEGARARLHKASI